MVNGETGVLAVKPVVMEQDKEFATVTIQDKREVALTVLMWTCQQTLKQKSKIVMKQLALQVGGNNIFFLISSIYLTITFLRC
jgi:hypothetical protein